MAVMSNFKRNLGFLLIALLCIGSAAAYSRPADSGYAPKQIALMTFNIRNATADDGHRDIADIASTILKGNADFVALQELDSVTARSGRMDILRELALQTQYYPVFSPAIKFGGGKYGIGILSKERPLSVRRVPLPGREEARTLLVAEFGDIVLACTHLSLTEADRMASLDIIRSEAQRCTKPFLLAGDFNDTPDSPFMELLRHDFTILSSKDKNTFPAKSPEECIDYVTAYRPTSESVVVRSAEVPDYGHTSDHRPVLLRFQLKTPAERMLVGEPYLQNPTGGGVSVMFQTRTRVHAWVEYGTDTLSLRRALMEYGGQAVCHDIEHRVRLEGLQPGQRYFYRVCAREILHYAAYSKIFGDTLRTPFRSFRLPSENQTDFTALIFNDLHQHSATIRKMAALAAAIPHDFVIFNGDCLAEPSDREDAIRTVHSLTSRFNTAEIPAFFVRGNHEIRNAYSAGLPSLLEHPGGQTYGAFSWGDTRFVILDCGEDKPDDHWVYYGLNDFTAFRLRQQDFLREEMQSRPFRRAARRVLVNHIPLWGNTDKYQPCSELWCPILGKARFDINVSAHTHEFRYHPIGDKGNPFPVCIGGGPATNEATMMVLSRKGKDMTLRVLDADGKELGMWNL